MWSQRTHEIYSEEIKGHMKYTVRGSGDSGDYYSVIGY